MIYQKSRASYVPAAVLSVFAALVALGLHAVCTVGSLKAIDVFLWIEGTVLLACAVQPDRVSLERNPVRRWLDPGFVGPSSFVSPFYHIGLALLAAAAIVGAFL